MLVGHLKSAVCVTPGTGTGKSALTRHLIGTMRGDGPHIATADAKIKMPAKTRLLVAQANQIMRDCSPCAPAPAYSNPDYV